MTPQQDDRQPSVDPEGNIIAASGTKSALKKRRRGSDESGEDEEEEAEPRPEVCDSAGFVVEGGKAS